MQIIQPTRRIEQSEEAMEKESGWMERSFQELQYVQYVYMSEFSKHCLHNTFCSSD